MLLLRGPYALTLTLSRREREQLKGPEYNPVSIAARLYVWYVDTGFFRFRGLVRARPGECQRGETGSNPALRAGPAGIAAIQRRGLSIKRQQTTGNARREREGTASSPHAPVGGGQSGLLKVSGYCVTVLALALLFLMAACGGMPSGEETAGTFQAPTATGEPENPTATRRASGFQTPDVNVPATVAAVLTRVATTPEPTPDVPSTVMAELTRVAPSTQASHRPMPAEGQAPSISDLVEAIEDGLFQILTPESSGSGFAISDDGLIITNAHLVKDHAFVSVRSVGGYSYAGLVRGKDDDLDLAVIKIHSMGNVKAMPLGDVSELRPGDPVFAMGFPLSEQLGDDYTITTGIVSSLRTSGPVARIQTDAAINAGNSGGPLLNSAGEVIGVNTATFREHIGISLAISIQEVKDNLDALTAGQSAPAQAMMEMQDHYNQDCRYSVQAPVGWEDDTGEEAGCGIYLAKYEGDVQVGAIQVWDYGLRARETLDGFSAWWEAEMAQRAADWHNFTHVSSGKSAVLRDGNRQEQYVIQYSWQETENHCLSFATDTITLNRELGLALVFSVNVCEFVSAPMFHAAASSTITVAAQ